MQLAKLVRNQKAKKAKMMMKVHSYKMNLKVRL